MQNKFLSIYRYRYLRDETSLSKSNNVLDVLQMNSLYHRREKADLVFLFKVLHGMADCSELLSQICLRVPRTATRLTTSFYSPRTLNILDHACFACAGHIMALQVILIFFVLLNLSDLSESCMSLVEPVVIVMLVYIILIRYIRFCGSLLLCVRTLCSVLSLLCISYLCVSMCYMYHIFYSMF